MARQTITKEVKDLLAAGQVYPDSVSMRKGVVTIRRGFFYSMGGNSEKFRAKVDAALKDSKFKTVDDGEQWASFRGGASVANSTHWWVIVGWEK